MRTALPGMVFFAAAVGCGGVSIGSTQGGGGTEGHVTGYVPGTDAGVDAPIDSGLDTRFEAGPDAGVDTSTVPKPACNTSTYNTWQRYPGSLSPSYPGATVASSLTLGANLVTTAGVIQAGFVVAPVDGSAGIGGDAYFWYLPSQNTWQRGIACTTQVYLPASASFPWVLVGATGPSCSLASQGIWYPTGPVGIGPPTYAQIPPYDASHTPTSFAVDSSGNVYTTGGSGTTCTTGSGVPYGACIQRYEGTSWTALAGSPGAQQVTSGSDDTVLFALDDNRAIWSVDYPGSAPWSLITVTSICGGGTLKPDLIAANSGFLFAIDDAAGGAGIVYSLSTAGSICWSSVDDSVRMMSISANPQLNGVNALLGTDGANGLWYYCNGNTP